MNITKLIAYLTTQKVQRINRKHNQIPGELILNGHGWLLSTLNYIALVHKK
jgi:hypothetical protein